MSYAEVKKVNGSPALVIDGKTHPPMAILCGLISRIISMI